MTARVDFLSFDKTSGVGIFAVIFPDLATNSDERLCYVPELGDILLSLVVSTTSDLDPSWKFMLLLTDPAEAMLQSCTAWAYYQKNCNGSQPQRSGDVSLKRGKPVQVYVLNKPLPSTDLSSIIVEVSFTVGRNALSHKKTTVSDEKLLGEEGSLANALSRMYNTAGFQGGDVKIIISAGPLAESTHAILAHQFILSARSPVFRTMLTSSMQEATTHEIHITDFSPEAVAAFVRFLHTDRCSHADLQAHTPQLLQLADKYQVPALGAVCAQYKRSALSCENALSVLKLADRCNAREVRLEALRFIAKHAEGMCKDVGHLEDVSAELLRDILEAVCARKNVTQPQQVMGTSAAPATVTGAAQRQSHFPGAFGAFGAPRSNTNANLFGGGVDPGF